MIWWTKKLPRVFTIRPGKGDCVSKLQKLLIKEEGVGKRALELGKSWRPTNTLFPTPSFPTPSINNPCNLDTRSLSSKLDFILFYFVFYVKSSYFCSFKWPLGRGLPQIHSRFLHPFITVMCNGVEAQRLKFAILSIHQPSLSSLFFFFLTFCGLLTAGL